MVGQLAQYQWPFQETKLEDPGISVEHMDVKCPNRHPEMAIVENQQLEPAFISACAAASRRFACAVVCAWMLLLCSNLPSGKLI